MPVSSPTDATEKQRKLSKQKKGPQKNASRAETFLVLHVPSCSGSNGTNMHASLLRQNADIFPLRSAFERSALRATRLSLYQLHNEIYTLLRSINNIFLKHHRLSPRGGWSWVDSKQNYRQSYLPGSFLTGCTKQNPVVIFRPFLPRYLHDLCFIAFLPNNQSHLLPSHCKPVHNRGVWRTVLRRIFLCVVDFTMPAAWWGERLH